MYQTYEFTYAGLPASMFGLSLCDIGGKKHGDNSFGNSANIVQTRIVGRIKPLHFGVRYHDEPLTFTLIFGAEKKLDRYEMQEVAQWLTGYQQYQWLTIDQPDLSNVQFRCLIQSLTPISVRWFPVAFEAKVVCDCPYGYGYPFSKSYLVSGQSTVRFYNESTCRENLKPTLRISVDAGCTSFRITNRSNDDKCIEFTDLPASGAEIEIDNENCIITEKNYGYDLYDRFNFQFFELIAGNNELLIEGNGSVTIDGRFLYNVGA